MSQNISKTGDKLGEHKKMQNENPKNEHQKKQETERESEISERSRQEESNYTFKNPTMADPRGALGSFDGISRFNTGKILEAAGKSGRKGNLLGSSNKASDYFIMDNVSFGRNNMGTRFQGRIAGGKTGCFKGEMMSQAQQCGGTMQTLKTQSVSKSSGRTGSDNSDGKLKEGERVEVSGGKASGHGDFKRKSGVVVRGMREVAMENVSCNKNYNKNDVNNNYNNNNKGKESDLIRLDKLDTMRERRGKDSTSKNDIKKMISAYEDFSSDSGRGCYFEQNEKETSFAKTPQLEFDDSKEKSKKKAKELETSESQRASDSEISRPRNSYVLPAQPRTSLCMPEKTPKNYHRGLEVGNSEMDILENPIVRIKNINKIAKQPKKTPQFPANYDKKFSIKNIYPQTTKNKGSYHGITYPYKKQSHINYPHNSSKKNFQAESHHRSNYIRQQSSNNKANKIDWKEIPIQLSQPRGHHRLSYTNSKDSYFQSKEPQALTKESYLNSKESAKSKLTRNSKLSWGSPKKKSHMPKKDCSNISKEHFQFNLEPHQPLSSISRYKSNMTPTQSFRTSLQRKTSRDQKIGTADYLQKFNGQSPTKISLYERPSHPSSKKFAGKKIIHEIAPNIRKFDTNLNLKNLDQISIQNPVGFNKSSRIQKMAGDLQLDQKDFHDRFFYTERRNLKTERSSRDKNLGEQARFFEADFISRGLETEPDRSYQASPRGLSNQNYEKASPQKSPQGKKICVKKEKHGKRWKKKTSKKKPAKKKSSKLSLDLESIALKTRISKKTKSIALRLEEKPRKVLLPYNFCSNRHYGSGLKSKVKFPMARDESSQNLLTVNYGSFKAKRRAYKASPANFSQKKSKLCGGKGGELSRGSRKEIHFGRGSYGNLENSFRIGGQQEVREKEGNAGRFFVGRKVSGLRGFKKKTGVKGRFLEIRRESLNGSNRDDFLRGDQSFGKQGFHSVNFC